MAFTSKICLEIGPGRDVVGIQKSDNKRMSGQDYDALAEMGGCTASAGGMPAMDNISSPPGLHLW